MSRDIACLDGVNSLGAGLNREKGEDSGPGTNVKNNLENGKSIPIKSTLLVMIAEF